MGSVAGPTFPQQLAAVRFHYFANEDSVEDLTRSVAARLWFVGCISRRVKGELIRACVVQCEMMLIQWPFGCFPVLCATERCISLLCRPFSQPCTHIWSVSVHGLRCWRFTTRHKCHISDSVAEKKKKQQPRSWIRSTVRGKQEAANHPNSKWSCNSTCFDSSGRRCAVCEPRLWQHSSIVAFLSLLPFEKLRITAEWETVWPK